MGLLGRLTTNPPRRPRRNRSRRTVQSAMENLSLGIPNQVSRQPNTMRAQGKQDHLDVSYEEYWGPLVKGANTFSFLPGSSKLPRLDAFGQMYEQYRIIRAIVHYRTSSGTTVSGKTIVGIDYDPADTVASTDIQIAALEPRIRVAVWQNGSLAVNASKANKANWLYTNGENSKHADLGAAFNALVWADVAASGDIWCQYTIRFTSPCPVPAAALQMTAPIASVTTEYLSVVPGALAVNPVASVIGHLTESNEDFKAISHDTDEKGILTSSFASLKQDLPSRVPN